VRRTKKPDQQPGARDNQAKRPLSLDSGFPPRAARILLRLEQGRRAAVAIHWPGSLDSSLGGVRMADRQAGCIVKREARDVQFLGSITHDGCRKRVRTDAKLRRDQAGSSGLLAVFLVNTEP